MVKTLYTKPTHRVSVPASALGIVIVALGIYSILGYLDPPSEGAGTPKDDGYKPPKAILQL